MLLLLYLATLRLIKSSTSRLVSHLHTYIKPLLSYSCFSAPSLLFYNILFTIIEASPTVQYLNNFNLGQMNKICSTVTTRPQHLQFVLKSISIVVETPMSCLNM